MRNRDLAYNFHFKPFENIRRPKEVQELYALDLNQDGLDDRIIVKDEPSECYIYAYEGTGYTLVDFGGSWEGHVADWDGDGVLDDIVQTNILGSPEDWKMRYVSGSLGTDILLL